MGSSQRDREDASVYVVVTIADNGVVHAWGDGPVYDPDGTQVVPFLGRPAARTAAARMRREEKARQNQPGEKGSVEVRVCKILGVDPVEVTPDAPAG